MSNVVKYYDQLAAHYDNDRFSNSYGKFIDIRERRILDGLLDGTEGVVLDLACGSGRLLNYATCGADASREMVQIAKEKHPEKEIYISDAANLPFENDSLDTIISFHFFMHLDTEKITDVFLECRRTLKPGGRIIFDIPSKKRRNITNYKAAGWHGATSFTIREIQQMNQDLFRMRRVSGLLFFPIHRFPAGLRRLFIKADGLLAGSFLKEYSSYLIVECVKK